MKLVFGLFLIISVGLSGQNSIRIYKQYNPSKTKKLSDDRIYTIKTDRTELFNQRIVGATDTSLKIAGYHGTFDTTIHITRHSNSRANDTSFIKIARIDTVDIPFRQIVSLKRMLLKNGQWAEPFLWLSFGGIGSIVLAPIVAVAESSDAGLQALKIGGSILAITLPVVYIASRKRTFDMKHDWTFIGGTATAR